MKARWFEDYSNIVLLTAWLAENKYSADVIAYAVEKPWKFEDEFLEAVNLSVGGSEGVDEDE